MNQKSNMLQKKNRDRKNGGYIYLYFIRKDIDVNEHDCYPTGFLSRSALAFKLVRNSELL
jgi:hypothetical protein